MERSQAPKRWLSVPSHDAAVVNNKRTKFSDSEPKHGQVSFRMLCHASRVGGIIGKSGSVIQQLQLETLTKIRIEEPPAAADVVDRFIVITGSAEVKPSALLIRRFREGNWGGEVEISAAQEALIRVFDRVLEVAADTDGVYIGPGRVVSCRLIARGGIERNIRAQPGCRISVSPAQRLRLSDELSDDDLLEIEGEVLAVKRALVAVSRCIQDREFVGRYGVMGSSFVDTHLEFFPSQGSSLHSPTSRNSINHAFDDRISPTESLRLPTHEVLRHEEVSFRILCSNDRVGSVIGKGGSIIKALKSETGAVISIGDLIEDCDERLITVKARENVESRHSQAQNAMVLVFSKFGETNYEKGTEPDVKKGKSVVARLVVPKKQIGCLLGKGGAVISEMRKTTRTGFHILKSTEVPKCASDDDQVVEITGEFEKVQNAIHHVTSRLRDNMFPRKLSGSSSILSIPPETTLYDRVRDSAPIKQRISDAASPNLSKHSNQSHITDYHQYSPELNRYLPPSRWTSQTMSGLNKRDLLDFEGVSSKRRGLDLGSGSMSAFITNTTVEIKIPDRLIGSIYGEDGSNMARLRQISGARVKVHEPLPGTREFTVVISGTPDETQAAQSLLQAFILTGSS